MGCSLKTVSIFLIILNLTLMASSLCYFLNGINFYVYFELLSKSTAIVIAAFCSVISIFFGFKSIFKCVGYLNHGSKIS